MVERKYMLFQKSFRLNSILLFGLFLVVGLSSAFAGIKDSIGIEKKEGKIFVLHQIDAKETLYSIAKRYSTKVEDIKLANPEMGEALKIGQTIRVPYKGIVQTLPGTSPSNDSKTHVVEKKETLYSIAKKYNVSVESIMKMNPGSESGVKEGQSLKIPLTQGTNTTTTNTVVQTTPKETTAVAVVKKEGLIHKVEPKETLYGIAKKYNVSVDDIKRANPELMEGLKEGMEISIPVKGSKNSTTTTTTTAVVVKEKEKEKDEDKPEVVPAKNQPKGEYKKVTENGNAEILESKSEVPKFQALHKSAPVGTIIQVVNEMNGQKIFVRVIGKLTDAESKTIIKISQKAMDRLEAKDKKIAVTLTYIP